MTPLTCGRVPGFFSSLSWRLARASTTSLRPKEHGLMATYGSGGVKVYSTSTSAPYLMNSHDDLGL